MRESDERERTVGIARYVTSAPGIGGRLRRDPADFRVRELETVEPAPTDADPGSYPYLLVRVHLREWDTNDFAHELSTRLGASRERIAWAGTKDKHAHTTQLFSIRDADPADLPEIADAEWTVVGRFGRSLSFGDLAGNAFRIRVRETEGDPDPVTADLRDWWRPDETEHETLAGAARVTDATRDGLNEWDDVDEWDGSSERDGSNERDDVDEWDGLNEWDDPSSDEATERTRVAVPNWYGHQRFGSRRPVTHEVGFRIAAGDPRGAVLTYAGNPFETEPEASREGRRVVDREAATDDPDWARARDALPDHLRFERAMLSRLVAWNDESGTATETDGETGAEPRETAEADAKWWDALDAVPSNLGRLFVNAAQSYLFNRILSERLERGLPFARPVAGDVVCFDADADRVARPDPDRTQRATEARLSVLERHCERGRAFVTAPVIGYDTRLADGEPGTIEREVLAEAGVEPGDFDRRDPYGTSGTRRAVLVGCALAVSRTDGDPVFRFALPSGAYATALLREYLQTPPNRL